jgi:D-glycerate 3-kinase
MPASQERIGEIVDSLVPYINRHIQAQSSTQTNRPFIFGLTGLQGSGKSTWTNAIVKRLNDKHNYRTINLSLDDLYLDHDELVKLRLTNPDNKLVQSRGQPGTHDMELARSFFQSLNSGSEVLIPSFDKSKFNGEGGRAPKETWQRIPAGTQIDVVIFEGWCVGFKPLDETVVRQKWDEGLRQEAGEGYPTKTLKEHALEHLLGVNEKLRQYCDQFMGSRHLDLLLHLDTLSLVTVYKWRIQQEHALREQTGHGMTDEEVIRFVKGYMPAYELYLDEMRDQLRHGFFEEKSKGRVRILLDQDREIQEFLAYSS